MPAMNKKSYCNLAWLTLMVVVVVISTSACSKRYSDLPAFSSLPIKDSVNNSVGRFKTSYLADQIHAYFRGNISGPIAVTTFVDIDDLYKTSSFGRILAEQLLSELSMRGYNVIEIRHSEVLQINYNTGEFGLSREPSLLKNNRDVSAIVVGTYSSSPMRVYVNARIIDPTSSMILSAGSVEMPLTEEINRMLRTNATTHSLERIPVRHLGYSVYPAPYYWPQFGYAYAAPFGGRFGFDDNEQWGPKRELRFVDPESESTDTPKPPEAKLDLGS
jgi:TolB-like protein